MNLLGEMEVEFGGNLWEIVLEAGIEDYEPDSRLVIGVVKIGFCKSFSV